MDAICGYTFNAVLTTGPALLHNLLEYCASAPGSVPCGITTTHKGSWIMAMPDRKHVRA